MIEPQKIADFTGDGLNIHRVIEICKECGGAEPVVGKFGTLLELLFLLYLAMIINPVDFNLSVRVQIIFRSGLFFNLSLLFLPRCEHISKLMYIP